MKGFRTTNLSAYFGCTVLVLGPVRLGNRTYRVWKLSAIRVSC